uniref:GK21394 n=1 Tax=Drosophila willistoni TaxID=7260 RepID=B4MQP5_DROWI
MQIYFISITILIIYLSLADGNQLKNAYEKCENLLLSLKTHLNELKTKATAIGESKPTSSSNDPSSCLAAYINTNGIHMIQVPGLEPFLVACDTRVAGAGWTVIQRRQDGTENFYRNWLEYRNGFGSLGGEFFIGLERLNHLTTAEPYELYIYLEDFNGDTRHAKYDNFTIDNEENSYAIASLGRYSGDAGDSFSYHKGMPFSTFDHDVSGKGCASTNVGAWWYNDCQQSNLNGQYVEGGKYEVKLSGRGICWKSWRGYDYGYKITQMMIRPKCSNSIRRQEQQQQLLREQELKNQPRSPRQTTQFVECQPGET